MSGRNPKTTKTILTSKPTMSERAKYPLIMTASEGADYLAQAGKRVDTAEFFRFVERFEIPPVDTAGANGKSRGQSIVRRKWSKAHIDLCLLTGLRFREALEWRQKAGFTAFCS